MTRRARTLCLLSLLFTSGSLPGDIVWKVADEGPRTPIVTEIVGDDARTIAFTAAGAAEFDGRGWHPIALNTDAVLPASRRIFMAGGQFAAVAVQDGILRLFLLRGLEWALVASVPNVSGPDSLSYGDDRIYVPDPTFHSCSRSGSCSETDAARHLRSISLVDGSVRDEAPLPSCDGALFTVSNRPYLIEFPPACGGGPSARNGPRPTATGIGAPFYRLDGDHWTSLPAWTSPTYSHLSTRNALWVLDTWDYRSRGSGVWLFTSEGLSPLYQLPPEIVSDGVAAVLELGERRLLVKAGGGPSIFELKGETFAPLTPASPVSSPTKPLVAAAGSRLFTAAEGWEVYVLGPSGWSEAPGAPSTPGAQRYLAGSTKMVAVRGNRMFRRGLGGWTRLALPPLDPLDYATCTAVVGDEPAVVAGFDKRALGGFVYDSAHDVWRAMDLPSNLGCPLWPTSTGLFADAGIAGVGRLRDGSWTILTPVLSEGRTTTGFHDLTEIGGTVYVLGCYATNAGSGICKVDGDHLVPAFPELEPDFVATDVAGTEGRLFLSTAGSPSGWQWPPVFMTFGPEGYRTALTFGDSRWLGRDNSFAVIQGIPFFDHRFYLRGQLRDQRSPVVPKILDRAGRFGYGNFRVSLQDRTPGSLFAPVRRVRKNVAAVVDTTGYWGTRYRSELHLANFSPNSRTVARLFAGAGTTPISEIPLEPGEQKTVEDPVVDFVGPLAVEFDGLVDEQDGWAAVRVWNESDGGTAGTSLVGMDPGSSSWSQTIVVPTKKGGSRFHLALAPTSYGSGEDVIVEFCNEWMDYDPCYRTTTMQIPAGALRQVDFGPERLDSSFTLRSRCGWCDLAITVDDLLGYVVRNEAGTNDGAVVPFEPPDALLGRRTRFLPALVGITSQFGTYRTELTFGRRQPDRWWEATLSFDVRFRTAEGSWSFPLLVDLVKSVEIPDAGAWLVANGVPIDPTNFVGTLTFTSDREGGAADLLVTAVVTARGPGASGDYGVSVPVFNEIQWASTEAIVPGLREDASFRSNLALASPEPDGGPPVSLEVSVRRASDGVSIGTLPPVTLAPGQRVQLNRLLSTIGYGGDAYAVVTRTGGTGRFVAYGVMNDNVTGDGTLFPMTRAK